MSHMARPLMSKQSYSGVNPPLMSKQGYSGVNPPRVPIRPAITPPKKNYNNLLYYSFVTFIAVSFVLIWTYWPIEESFLQNDEDDVEVVEEIEDLFHGCPVCGPGLYPRRPMNDSLSSPRAKIKLCTGSILSPFASGTLAIESNDTYDGIGTGTIFAQITVFEAEIIRPPRLTLGKKTADLKKPTEIILRFLVFLEDENSIKKTQWDGWGAAEPSAVYHKSGQYPLFRCLIWPGQDAALQGLKPTYDVEAKFEKLYSFHGELICRIPKFPTVSDDGTVTGRGKEYFVQHGHNFQVQLKGINSSVHVRMGPIPICRSDGEEPPPILAPVSSLYYTKITTNLEANRSSEKNLTAVFSRELLQPDSAHKKTIKPMQVTVCVRPYHETQMFSQVKAFSDVRLLEWIDGLLMMGVDRIYFYDRFGTDKKALLREYIERGQVLHVPFPQWSEVFYRKKLYSGKARVPYLFPEIYDQILASEHCLMLGRRYNDNWQFHIDVDEFLWYEPKLGARLKPLLARLEANHSSSPGALPLKVIKLRRYNFFGVEKESREEPVGSRLVWRCTQPIWHTEGWVGWQDKMAVNPQHILPDTAIIHNTDSPKEHVAVAHRDMFHINHYTSMTIDLGHHPCRAWVKPVKDEGLIWVALKVWKCRQFACSRKIAVECWPFCKLPWPKEEADHKGAPDPDLDLRALLDEASTITSSLSAEQKNVTDSMSTNSTSLPELESNDTSVIEDISVPDPSPQNPAQVSNSSQFEAGEVSNATESTPVEKQQSETSALQSEQHVNVTEVQVEQSAPRVAKQETAEADAKLKPVESNPAVSRGITTILDSLGSIIPSASDSSKLDALIKVLEELKKQNEKEL